MGVSLVMFPLLWYNRFQEKEVLNYVLEKITWKQAEGYFKEKDIAIIPVGSTENHGSQLCLGTDFLIPRRLCEE